MKDLFGTSCTRLRVPAIGLIVAMVLSMLATTTAGATPVTSTSAQQAQAVGRHTVLDNEFGKLKSRVVGTFGNGGTIDGTFKPRRFKTVGNQLVAVGKLQAELTRANGNVVDEVTQRVTLPVATASGLPLPLLREGRAAATCDILRLVLGPLDLDLLGLQVHLDRVVLNIVAESGAGNLLGNLLCAVAGLLDNTGTLPEISQILKTLLAILRL